MPPICSNSMRHSRPRIHIGGKLSPTQSALCTCRKDSSALKQASLSGRQSPSHLQERLSDIEFRLAKKVFCITARILHRKTTEPEPPLWNHRCGSGFVTAGDKYAVLISKMATIPPNWLPSGAMR